MSSSQFTQFFSGSSPACQFPSSGAPPPQPGPPAAAGVDQLVNQLEYSYLDIPHLLGESDEETEGLPPAERQRRRQERLRREAELRQQALARALAGQGVVGAAPGFDPTPYQQHLQHLHAQQQQQQQAGASAAFQQQQQQQQPGCGPQTAHQPFPGH